MIIDIRKIDQVSEDCFEGMIGESKDIFEAFGLKNLQTAQITYSSAKYTFVIKRLYRDFSCLMEDYSYELTGKLPQTDITPDNEYNIRQLWPSFNAKTFNGRRYTRMISVGGSLISPVYTQNMELLPIADVQERTMCYDPEQYAAWWRSAEYAKLAEKYDRGNDGKKYYGKSLGKIVERKPFDFEKNPSWYMLPTGVEELTHEQIRRRILNFVAMLKDCMTPKVMRHILDAYPRTKAGRLSRGKRLYIASLPIWKFGRKEGIRTWIVADAGGYIEEGQTENTIELLVVGNSAQGRGIAIDEGWFECTDQPTAAQIAAGEQRRKQLAEELIEGANKKQSKKKCIAKGLATCIEDVDAMDPALFADVLTTDSDGNIDLVALQRNQRTFTIENKEITVNYNASKVMKQLKAELKFLPESDADGDAPNDCGVYDLDSVLSLAGEHEVFTDENSGSVVFELEENFPEDAELITNRQLYNRMMWFNKVCALCCEESVMRRIAECAPKKKDKTLHRKRLLHIASDFAGASSILELVAINKSDTEVELKLRTTRVWHDTLDEVKHCMAFTTDAFAMHPLEIPQSEPGKKKRKSNRPKGN